MRFQILAGVELEDGVLVYRSEYNPGLVAALKAAIPASDRKWDPTHKVWLVHPRHGPALRDITAEYLGEFLVLPKGTMCTSHIYTESRILDVRYIGRCKDQGGGDLAAFGWVNGKWSAIFPEAVLRDWFCSQQRPGETPTLYATLGIKRDAAPYEVRAAHRRLALQWHPDRCSEPDAAKQFICIQRAYEVLGDEHKRAKYDAGLVLAATAHTASRQDTGFFFAPGYRSPLRCGLIMAEGVERLGRFVVSRILAWEDIQNDQGQVLVTSWPRGGKMFVERWV